MIGNLLAGVPSGITAGSIALGLGGMAVLFLAVLAMRPFWSWYFNLNQALEELRAIRMELRELNVRARMEGSGAAAAERPKARAAAMPAVPASKPAPAEAAPAAPHPEEEPPHALPIEEQMIRRSQEQARAQAAEVRVAAPRPTPEPAPHRASAVVVETGDVADEAAHRCPLPEL